MTRTDPLPPISALDIADSTVSETVTDGSRYCAKCGEFLGMVCDPFGRSKCGSNCFEQEAPDAAYKPLPDDLCEDCPPEGYPTEKTRCLPCPRRISGKPLPVEMCGYCYGAKRITLSDGIGSEVCHLCDGTGTEPGEKK